MFEKHISVLVSFCCNYSGYFCGIRLDSKAASRIYKMVLAENDSMTYMVQFVMALQDSIKFQI